MTPNPSLLPEVWDALPVEARTLVEAMRHQIEVMQRQIDALQGQVRSLQAQLGSNSHNSSKPPSSDPIHLKRQPPKLPSDKKRDGQPGHQRATRPLVPPDQIDQAITSKPTACGGCSTALHGDDLTPIRHQVAEIPPIRPTVVEYQLHRLTCTRCGRTTTAPLPPGTPRGAFGPRLQAVLGLMAGAFRLSQRPVQRLAGDLLGLNISLGRIAKLQRRTAILLGPLDAELAELVRLAPASHIDETPWREANQKAWLWVGTGEGVTHFRISRHRDAPTARQILGEDSAKVAICDRYAAYGWVKKKPWCWAHLRRDSQAMIDRADGGSTLGSRLLKLSDDLFWGWHRVGDGDLSWEDFLRWAKPIRQGFSQKLSQGVLCVSLKTAATCRHRLGGQEHLWRFLAGDGVEPTNNLAERALRHGVLWRKSSGGTASVWGSRFVSRLLSEVATCRQQGRPVLEFLTTCFKSDLNAQRLPLLQPRAAPVSC